jgi:hypothetical protein
MACTLVTGINPTNQLITTNIMSTPTTTTTPKFILIGRNADWSTAFAVEESAATYVLNLLNRQDDDDWIGITVPLAAEEIESTFADWRKNGVID